MFVFESLFPKTFLCSDSLELFLDKSLSGQCSCLYLDFSPWKIDAQMLVKVKATL